MAFTILSASAAVAQEARGETVIGRWCDRALPGRPDFNMVRSIIAGSDGTVIMRIQANDGSDWVDPLREARGGVFHKEDSPTGDSYRIVQNTGDLQLIDDAGLIRVAERLENVPTRGECSH